MSIFTDLTVRRSRRDRRAIRQDRSWPTYPPRPNRNHDETATVGHAAERLPLLTPVAIAVINELRLLPSHIANTMFQTNNAAEPVIRVMDVTPGSPNWTLSYRLPGDATVRTMLTPTPTDDEVIVAQMRIKLSSLRRPASVSI